MAKRPCFIGIGDASGRRRLGCPVRSRNRDRFDRKKLQYDGAWQDFRASGRTLYNAGRDSWGYWAIRDDQYCSQWPPQALWDCYDVAAKGDQIRFMGAHNDVTDGVFVTE